MASDPWPERLGLLGATAWRIAGNGRISELHGAPFGAAGVVGVPRIGDAIEAVFVAPLVEDVHRARRGEVAVRMVAAPTGGARLFRHVAAGADVLGMVVDLPCTATLTPPADTESDAGARVRQRLTDEGSVVVWLGRLPFGPGNVDYLGGDFEGLFGRPRAEVLEGRVPVLELVHPDDRAELLAVRARSVVAHDHVYRVVRPDGTVRWVHVRTRPLPGPDGATPRYVGVLDDVTARYEAALAQARTEADLRGLLAARNAAVREVHHRVKNNLQLVSSLLQLEARGAGDGEARRHLDDARDRIQAIALVHEMLYVADDLSGVRFDAYVTQLVRALQTGVPAAARIATRVAVAPRELELELPIAVPCALLINELVTNAYKHGFPDGRAGTVTIALSGGDAQLQLTVADDGVGMGAIDWETVGTLGYRLVRALAQQLHGSIAVERAGGTRVRISFPMERAR